VPFSLKEAFVTVFFFSLLFLTPIIKWPFAPWQAGILQGDKALYEEHWRNEKLEVG